MYYRYLSTLDLDFMTICVFVIKGKHNGNILLYAFLFGMVFYGELIIIPIVIIKYAHYLLHCQFSIFGKTLR